MKVEEFASKHLEFKKAVALEVFQGYLIAGKTKDNDSCCFWVNKKNIEGIAEVAKIVAIDSAFQGLLSLIPGGSFAYRLIKDQIGHPPRYNVIFDPKYYIITYSTVTLDKKGESKGIVDGFVQGIDNLAKIAMKTGSSLLDFITKGRSKSIEPDMNDVLGFTYIRFDDITSVVRSKIIDKRLSNTKSTPSRLAKATVVEMVPSVVISFKTTANDKAINFLKYLQKLGFNVNFSAEDLEEKE